jgi:hypothetical protein
MKKKKQIDHASGLDDVLRALEKMSSKSPNSKLTNGGKAVGVAELYKAAQAAGDAYRKGCGMASRKQLPEVSRQKVRKLLFRARYVLDSRIENTIYSLIKSGSMPVTKLLKRQVFGFCKKQGVSFRLSLSTCVPSPLCGGGCYAHDGRERVTSTILSGCYNTIIARLFDEKLIGESDLLPHVKKAVDLAKEDTKFSKKEYGHARRGRIRLSHVGELAAYPKFANWLGHAIREVSAGTVDGVIYTRHPKIKDLDTNALVINLTIDESSEGRRKWRRDGVRLVWSAWGGHLDPEAEVNFLEHHDHGQHAKPHGVGEVCPVTVATTEQRFCDAFHCTKCFDDPNDDATSNSSDHHKIKGHFRTRTQKMVREPKKNS